MGNNNNMDKRRVKKEVKETENIKIIDSSYLSEKLEIELTKINITLLHINVHFLKSIGAKIDATIYKEDGISHQNCSETTRIIKTIINENSDNTSKNDEYDEADEYGITVSSPGLKWLFKGEKEFEIFKNAPIKVIYNKKASEIIDAKTVTGLLLGSDDSSIEIENERENITILRDAIEKIYLNY